MDSTVHDNHKMFKKERSKPLPLLGFDGILVKKNWHFFLKKQQIGNFCLATSSFWQVWIFPTLPRKNGRLCLSTLRKMIEKWRVFAQRSFTHSHEKWKSSIWKLKMKRLMLTYHLMKVVDLFLYYRMMFWSVSSVFRVRKKIVLIESMGFW